MATVAVRGSAVIGTNGTTWATTSNAVDGAVGVNNATYATYTNATASATGYIELGTYGFDSTIGASDTINSVTVNLRHFENNTGRFASVRFQPYDGATAIGSLFTCTLATAARNDSTTFSPTLAQVRSSTFKIRVTITGAASTQSRVESIDYVDVTVDYTPLAPTITQAAYRFYADGTETGSTALASQDTAYTADTSGGDVNLALRVRLQSTNAGTIASTDDWQLQYDKNSSGTWNNAAAESLLTEYPESNEGSAQNIGGLTGGLKVVSEAILGDGNKLARARFKLSKTGSPTGNLTCVVHTHSGTFGSGTASGSALTTSTTTASIATLTGTSTWASFDFDRTFTLTNGTAYYIGVETDQTANDSNYVNVGADASSPTYAGNHAQRNNAGSWSSFSNIDLIFEVYTAGTSSAVVEYVSANLTDAAATTNRLGSGTGSFVAGKISEDSVVDDFGWTANNYTELLYSITIESTAVTASDTLTFRVLRNAATTGMTYTVTPSITIGSGGNATATPAVIARSVAVPAVTPLADSTTAPALIARSVAVPTATGQANAQPSPALIARAVTLDAPTPQTASTPSPAAIARTVVVPAATGSGQSSATATPAVISSTVAIPATTTTAGTGSNATPAVIARAVTIGATTPQAASSTTPAVIARSAVVPATTPQAGSTTTPALIARSATIPATTPQAGATVSPVAIARDTVIQMPTPHAGSSVSPAPNGIVVTLAIVSATGVSAGTTTPAVIARTAVVPTVTASGTSAATGAPAVIIPLITLPATTTTAATSATATPTTIVRLIVLPAATASVGEPAATLPLYFGATPVTGAYIGSTPVTCRLGTVEVTR